MCKIVNSGDLAKRQVAAVVLCWLTDTKAICVINGGESDAKNYEY